MDKTFKTQVNRMKGLTKQEYRVLRELCSISKNLYNVSLYNIRQHYFTEKSFLTYESNYHVAKHNENYKLLQAGISQQILKVVDRSFKSFFNLMKKAKQGEYRFQDVKIPKYLAKDGLFPLILSTNAIRVKDGYFFIPLSNAYKKKSGLKEIKIKFPPQLVGKTLKEVRIIPKAKGKRFDIHYVYEQPFETVMLDKEKAMSIDIGLNNVATCVTSDGLSYLYDGKPLKSINHYYNKQKAKYQSIAIKQGMKYTNRLASMDIKRNNRVKDYMRKVARSIIELCKGQQIGTLVIGYNKDFKRGLNLGKKNNQQFTQIPFGLLREYLYNLCEHYGINYVEQEESYTSKASFFDNDALPVWTAEKQNMSFSGKRIKRGLYQTAKGILVNADINGALNILRKSNLIDTRILQAKGCLAHPQRVRIV
ncbi:putative transposase [Metalysinibacillus saudimassiliensis]|uniref:Putative transposase n=1 Tax=Metalysinibacillus saudimassiliensis TaxID=1461583 RepID=A0A078MJ23_9BACL|nr:RNA-guided endonuclease TnpB family protein [Metalysinibacillus jejuensis]CEA05417.1 putative transposase [Metalysinibacillus saudimassiliensis]